MHGVRFIIGLSVISALCASAATAVALHFLKTETPGPTKETLIANSYAVAAAQNMDPRTLRRNLDAGNETSALVDLRSPQEYADEHIVSALNIPVFSDPHTSTLNETERIIAAFQVLAAQNPSKDIIVYAHNGPSLTTEMVGALLAEQGILVKQLTIGWNEWRYYWTLWNHKDEWTGIGSEDYLWRGNEPGVPERR